MHNYNFENLNPLEFEGLINDLLSIFFKSIIERFKPGKDQGIDGRFFQTNDKFCIIQSKHYLTSGIKGLLTGLKNELPKINLIKPNRYILATSVPLSPKDKSKILSILSPHIKRSDDILGQGEINKLISDYPDIERNHYKLWITSTTVLCRIIHSATYAVSKQVLDDAIESNKNYAITSAHINARNILDKYNVIVITGDPGVGKTTLAEQLCLELVVNDYELLAINSIDEAYRVHDTRNKQVFYFDDFLGKNFLETLRRNEDSQIMRFISYIHKAKQSKFILTSRTNILDQGYIVGQNFSTHNLSKDEFILDIGKYTPHEKARILYSFMWKSRLKLDYMQEIINDGTYEKIINHKNYNPRILEFITSSDITKLTVPTDYPKYIEARLDNPKEVWENPYAVQLDDLGRALVDLVVLSGGSIEEDKLSNAFYKYTQDAVYCLNSTISREFELVSRSLSRSFIKRSIIARSDNKAVYAPFNPSVSDYIIDKYLRNKNKFAEMILYYDNDEGLEILEKLWLSHKEFVNSVSSTIVETLNENLFSKSFMFISRITNLLSNDIFAKTFIKVSFEYIFQKISNCSDAFDLQQIEFVDKYLALGEYHADHLRNLLDAVLKNIYSYTILEYFSNFILSFDFSEHVHDPLAEAFHAKLLVLWGEDVSYEFANENIEDISSREICEEEDGYNEEVYVDINQLARLASDSTTHLFTTISESEAYDIFSPLNLEAMATDYYKDTESNEFHGRNHGATPSSIDDIFAGFIESKYGH